MKHARELGRLRRAVWIIEEHTPRGGWRATPLLFHTAGQARRYLPPSGASVVRRVMRYVPDGDGS